MNKYTGLALVGFCGIFIVMIIIYALGTFTTIFGDGISEPDMDEMLPRMGWTFAGLVICILLAIKGVRIIQRSD